MNQKKQPANPRDWPEDFSHENGNYQCQCVTCGEMFIGHKRRVHCKLCTNPSHAPFRDIRDATDFLRTVFKRGIWEEETKEVATMLESLWASKEAGDKRISELEQMLVGHKQTIAALSPPSDAAAHPLARMDQAVIAGLRTKVADRDKRIAELERALRALISIDDGDGPELWGYEYAFIDARAALAAPLSTHEGTK